jgi:hypothetical protein
MTDEQSVQPARGNFPSTHWSCVAEAADLESPGTKDALTALCLSYWYPLFVFIRSRGHGAEDASDLVQEYFALTQVARAGRGRSCQGAVPYFCCPRNPPAWA